MSTDRSHLLCLKPVSTPMGERYCTHELGHDTQRFNAFPCEYVAHFHGGEWVEACQYCGGPLGAVAVCIDEHNKLRCGACWQDIDGAQWDAHWKDVRAQADRRRRTELRRAARRTRMSD